MAISAAEYQRRLKSILSITKLREIVNEELIKEESTLKMLKEQDYLEGDIYGNGTLNSYRSKNYELFKAQQNPIAGGAVDLILTGAFIESFYLLKPKQNKYLFGARDKKRNMLVEKYGIGIMGLNQNVFNKFQKDIIASRAIRKIKNNAKIS